MRSLANKPRISYRVDTGFRMERPFDPSKPIDRENSSNKVNPHARTMYSMNRPQRPSWQRLRETYRRYLREAPTGAAPEPYVDGSVPPEDAALLTDRHRRYVELQIDGDEVARMMRHAQHFMRHKVEPARDAAITLLRRIAQAHVSEESPHLIPIFHAGMWVMESSAKEGHIGNRKVGGEIVGLTAPHLPAHTECVYGAARMVRLFAVEQRPDADVMMRTYKALIPGFEPHYPEVAKGRTAFHGLSQNAQDYVLRNLAQSVYFDLRGLTYPHAAVGGYYAWGPNLARPR